MIPTAHLRSFRLGLIKPMSTHISFHCQAYARVFSSARSQLDEDRVYPSRREKKRVLQYGRSKRKLETKRRGREVLSSRSRVEKADEHEVSPVTPQQHETAENNVHVAGSYDNWHIVKLRSQRIEWGNPIRELYVQNQIPWKYPRTIEGWRTCWRRAWGTYLWTWEGFLRAERERDEYGNIVGIKREKDEEERNTKEIAKEKATDAANQIAQNVQKNVATIQEEAPKLLATAQKLTGITTKEELKQWVGAQLKLGTECLSMFMKGYRKGRDDEVDKMLHEYFKELDEDKDQEALARGAAAKMQNNDNKKSIGNTTNMKLEEKRLWGRNARRCAKRKKVFSG